MLPSLGGKLRALTRHEKSVFRCVCFVVTSYARNAPRVMRSLRKRALDVPTIDRSPCLRWRWHLFRPKDAFYDRGSTFPLNLFLNDGAPSPSVVGMPNVVSEIDLFFCTGVMGFFIKMRFGLG